jgi:hypothetical protein
MLNGSNEEEAVLRIRSSRKRTNILREPEYIVIEFLCKIMPRWISPDMLSAIGMAGSILSACSIFFATYNRATLLLVVPGMIIQWFGDSLDGRIAYYRNQPRKWYGWLLDMNLDWISTVLLATAFLYYISDYPLLAFLFMAAYGQTFILAIMRYRITDIFLIDADSPIGPTELRIILTVSTAMEYFIPGFIIWFGVAGILVISILNAVDFFRLIKIANAKDIEEAALVGKKIPPPAVHHITTDNTPIEL